MEKSLLQKIVPFNDLKETIFRFPLSVLCALSIFVISISLVHDFVDKEEWLARVIAILGACYLWFGISKLMAESQGWGRVKYLVVSFVIASGIAAIILLSSFWYVNLIFVVPALLLTLMVAPYLTGGNDISVWFFNRITWFGVAVSCIAIILFAGSLSIALLAVDTLFGVSVEGKVYADIWLFASMVLGSVYALSWVPKKFEFSDDDCSDPAGLKFIVNWILVPMIFVYLLILYAYFIKIIVTGEIPNGNLAYMISGFAGAGIVTYLTAWPFRNEGSPQLKLFYKIFFPALLIPVGFHFYAIWERIAAYGVTEQRYLLLISAIWFMLMAVSNSFKKIPIKAIPASLAILMILASFGPWGGASVSGYSQFSRLEMLLTKNNLLVDGKITKAKAEISFEDRKSISSILDYLCRSDRDEMIEPWFNVDSREGWDCHGGRNLTKQLGFDYISQYDINRHNKGQFNIRAGKESYMYVGGYDHLIKNIYFYNYNLVNGKTWKRIWDVENNQKVNMEHLDSNLSVSIGDYEKIEINLSDAIGNIISEFYINNNGFAQDIERDIIIESENEDIAYRIIFRSLGGGIEDKKPVIGNANFDFLYRIKNNQP